MSASTDVRSCGPLSAAAAEGAAEGAPAGTGLAWDIDLALPGAYPTSAAPDGRGVLLSRAALVEAMWLEAEWSRDAWQAVDTSLEPSYDARYRLAGDSKYLEVNVVVFRPSDGRVCVPRQDARLATRERSAHDLSDGLYFNAVPLPSAGGGSPLWGVGAESVVLKARLTPKLPLPEGAVPRDARVPWVLAIELAVQPRAAARAPAPHPFIGVGRNFGRDDERWDNGLAGMRELFEDVARWE